MSLENQALPFRQGVGICLFNRQGFVLCAERRDRAGAWQMPQGGVQKDEDPAQAALREMDEEIGTNKALFLDRVPDVLSYEFPDYLQYRKGVFRGKYRGQQQIWYAFLFQGEDSDINLAGEHEPEWPEFVAWRWTPLVETPRLIVEFKRPVYDAVVKAFTPIAEALAAGRDLPTYPTWPPEGV